MVVTTLLALSAGGPSFAQDAGAAASVEDREADLFGDEEDDADAEEALGFESTEDVLEGIQEKIEEADKEVAIGGFVFSQLNLTLNDRPETWDDTRWSAPNLFDVFLDARPNDRVRAYIRGRLNYNPSLGAQPQASGATDDAQADPFGALLGGAQPDGGAFAGGAAALAGGRQQELQAQLDQLWVKFDIARAIYVTAGRQRIRWGAGRFFNPTDFLNATQINPVALFDARLGVDMLKLHLPVSSLGWNLYAIALLGQVDTLDDLGGALRAEFLLGTAELAVSFLARRQAAPGPTTIEVPNPVAPDRPLTLYPEPGDTQTQQAIERFPKETVPLRLGLDASLPLDLLFFNATDLPVELRFEGALSRGLPQPFWGGTFAFDLSGAGAPGFTFPELLEREEEWIFQGVASVEWIIEYMENETMIVIAEYFYNDLGYPSADLYTWLLLQGGFSPLSLGRHYAGGAVVLPAPGRLDGMTFSASTLANLSDRSALSRLDYALNIHGELSWNLSATVFYGEPGEFRFGLGPFDVADGTQTFELKPTRVALSTGLRLSF